jgi:hypothetical protein
VKTLIGKETYYKEMEKKKTPKEHNFAVVKAAASAKCTG